MTSCSHQMLALLSAVYILIFFLGGLPAVHARSDHASVKHFCGLEFSYAVVTACGEAKRSIRSAPFFDMFPVFKSPERIPADFDDSSMIHVRKRQDYQGMATYCCTNGCTISQLTNSGIC
ncbi:gonad-stimulating substance-like [Asterias rubens]|uniref:Relaxin-like peptide 2 n=1 Tax=Asterias rubens TaxID=7604 RepID=A0A0U2PVD5_ASTRU|nr:gonad-stimulating substance-like [Asterias rubens]ALJ99971.1 relaxin-like peptide precursor 2 [Asterias rubens]